MAIYLGTAAVILTDNAYMVFKECSLVPRLHDEPGSMSWLV